MPAGRPPEPVPQDVAEAIIDYLYEGGSLLQFCAQAGRPKRRTVYDWRAKDPVFDAQFARAMRASADVHVDMAQEVADDGRNDWMEIQNKDGENIGWKVNGEHVQRSKLRVDVLLRRAACKAPDVYGSKVADQSDRVQDQAQRLLQAVAEMRRAAAGSPDAKPTVPDHGGEDIDGGEATP